MILALTVRKTTCSGIEQTLRRSAVGTLAQWASALLQACDELQVGAGAVVGEAASLRRTGAGGFRAIASCITGYSPASQTDQGKEHLARKVLQATGGNVFHAVHGFTGTSNLLRASIHGQTIELGKKRAGLIGETTGLTDGLAFKGFAVGTDSLWTSAHVIAGDSREVGALSIRKAACSSRRRTIHR